MSRERARMEWAAHTIGAGAAVLASITNSPHPTLPVSLAADVVAVIGGVIILWTFRRPLAALLHGR